jgi:peroxiredoxin
MDIVAITLESDKDKVSRFMQDNNLKFPVVLDRDKSLFERFYVAVTPTKILLAPDSRVLHVWKGLTTQLSSSSELIDLIATFGVETQSLPMPPTSSTP